MNIIKHELRANLIPLIIWSVSLMALLYMTSIEFEAFQGNEDIQDLMESDMYVQFFAALGVGEISFVTPEGFLTILSLYIYLPLSIYAGLLGAGIISKEEKNKTAEYLFTLPVSRKRVLLSKSISGLINVIVINLLVIISAMLIFGRFETSNFYYQFILNLGVGVLLTQLIFYSIGLGLASVLKDYKKSGSLTITILMGTYMLSVLSNMVEEADLLKYFSPFKYFEAAAMLDGEFSLTFFIITISIIITGISSLFYFYQKRDLYI